MKFFGKDMTWCMWTCLIISVLAFICFIVFLSIGCEFLQGEIDGTNTVDTFSHSSGLQADPELVDQQATNQLIKELGKVTQANSELTVGEHLEFLTEEAARRRELLAELKQEEGVWGITFEGAARRLGEIDAMIDILHGADKEQLASDYLQTLTQQDLSFEQQSVVDDTYKFKNGFDYPPVGGSVMTADPMGAEHANVQLKSSEGFLIGASISGFVTAAGMGGFIHKSPSHQMKWIAYVLLFCMIACMCIGLIWGVGGLEGIESQTAQIVATVCTSVMFLLFAGTVVYGCVKKHPEAFTAMGEKGDDAIASPGQHDGPSTYPAAGEGAEMRRRLTCRPLHKTMDQIIQSRH